MSNHDAHSANLATMLASFQSTFTYTDLRISASDGVTYEVHQAVLASVSPFLAKLFKERGCCMCQDQSCEKKNLSLILDKVQGTTLGKFLNFVYKGEMLLQGKVEFVKFYSLLKLIGAVLPNEVKSQMKDYYRYLADPNSFAGNNFEDHHPTHSKAPPTIAKQETIRQPFVCPSELVEISVDNATVIEANIIEVDTLSCRFCHVLCDTELSLKTHYAKEHFYNHLCDEFGHLRSCSPCGVAYLHPSEIALHFGVAHNRIEDLLYYCRETDKDLSCAECEKGFVAPKSLIMHMASTHQKSAIETMFHVQADCPVCGTGLDNPKEFYGHLVLEHDVLYQVVPILIRRRLQRLAELESYRIRPASHDDDGLDYPIEEDTETNLTCPVCYQVFDREEDLKLDVASHYEATLNRVLSKQPGICPSCDVTGSKSDVFTHWILDHPDTLAKYIPELMKSKISPSIISREDETNHDESQSSVSGPPKSRLNEDKVYKCGVCLRNLLKKSVPNHYCNVHLKAELMKYCRIEDNLCLICNMTFRQQRRTFVHVGQAHGFMASLLAKYPLIEENAETFTPPPENENEDSVPYQEIDENQAAQLEPLQKEVPESEEYPCFLCEDTYFAQWYEWKEHLYENHYANEIMEKYRVHKTACPICQFKASDTRALGLHIAVGHDKIFDVMPPKHLRRIRNKGLRCAPDEIEFHCPMCTKEKRIVGAPIFRRHLFKHCSARFKSHFNACGRKCPYCNYVSSEPLINLRHIAIIHGKLEKYLPQEVVQNAKEQGLSFKPVLRNGRHRNPNSEVWSAPRKFGKKTKRSYKFPNHPKKRPVFKPKDLANTKCCPICNRRFQCTGKGNQEAKRHLLNHYKVQFMDLYSRFENNCPICSYSTPIFNDCMRHIAGTHYRVLNVLPADILVKGIRTGFIPKSAVLECRNGVENGQLPENFQCELNSIDLDSISVAKTVKETQKKPTENQDTSIGIPENEMESESSLYNDGIRSPHLNHSRVTSNTEEETFHGFNGISNPEPTHLEDANNQTVQDNQVEKHNESILKSVTSDHVSIPCCICKKVLLKKKILSHLATHFKDELIKIFFNNHDNISSCPICRESYLSQEAFIFHMSGKHGKVLECLSETDRSEMERLGFVPDQPRVRNRARQPMLGRNNSPSVHGDSEVDSNISPAKETEITMPNNTIKISLKQEKIDDPEEIEDQPDELVDEVLPEKTPTRIRKFSVSSQKDLQEGPSGVEVSKSLKSNLSEAETSKEHRIQENGLKLTLKLREKPRIPETRIKEASERSNDESLEEQAPPAKKRKTHHNVEEFYASVEKVIIPMGERFACGLCSSVLGGSINDIRRHVLGHFSNGLIGEVSHYDLKCLECKKSYSKPKFIFHMFLSHRMYEDSPSIPENVRQSIAQTFLHIKPQLKKILPRNMSPRTKEVSSTTKTPKFTWKMNLFLKHKQDLQSMFPNARAKCPLCQIQLASNELCLHHLAFQHYRILHFVQSLEIHRDILINTNPIVPPISKAYFRCSDCSFASGDPKELQEHMTCHYYGTAKEIVVKGLVDSGSIQNDQNETFSTVLKEIQNSTKTRIPKSSDWEKRFEELRGVRRSQETKSITSGPFVDLRQVSPVTRLEEAKLTWSDQATFGGVLFY